MFHSAQRTSKYRTCSKRSGGGFAKGTMRPTTWPYVYGAWPGLDTAPTLEARPRTARKHGSSSSCRTRGVGQKAPKSLGRCHARHQLLPFDLKANKASAGVADFLLFVLDGFYSKTSKASKRSAGCLCSDRSILQIIPVAVSLRCKVYWEEGRKATRQATSPSQFFSDCNGPCIYLSITSP